MSDAVRVLVKETIAEAGVELLRERFAVDVEIEMPPEDLSDRIGDYDALIVRSATAVTGDLLERAERLKVIGRAGTGVDNVDVALATMMPRLVAAASSTLSTPVPARPITLSRSARSSRSPVTAVALRTISAS